MRRCYQAVAIALLLLGLAGSSAGQLGNFTVPAAQLGPGADASTRWRYVTTGAELVAALRDAPTVTRAVLLRNIRLETADFAGPGGVVSEPPLVLRTSFFISGAAGDPTLTVLDLNYLPKKVCDHSQRKLNGSHVSGASFRG